MITKKQWGTLCNNLRTKRNEGFDVYYGQHCHKLIACFAYRNKVLTTDDTVLTHLDFKDQSYKEIRSQFFYIKLADFTEIL